MVKRVGCKPAKWSLQLEAEGKGERARSLGSRSWSGLTIAWEAEAASSGQTPWCLTVKLLVTVVASELGVASGWVRGGAMVHCSLRKGTLQVSPFLPEILCF